jgi:3-hydroxyisobutyrate dehydrogenase/2-hydroxy-3-oxopropionate reductase
MKKIGFVGLGIMGSSMARNLMKAGFEVHGYARHPQKVQDLVSEGLVLHDTLKDAVKEADVMISIVGYPADVKEVYYGSEGILENLKPGAMAIDMTTSDPDLAKELYAAGKEKGVSVLDAPVTGGDAGARNGTLTILAAGDKEAFDAVQDVFNAMGTHICYQGEAGNGQSAKLVNQILIAGAMGGLAEAWAYAQNLGLDPANLYESLHQGAAGSKSLDLYWPRLENGDLNPGFFVKHFIKDLKLAQNQAKNKGLKMPVVDQVLQEYEDLNMDDAGTQALVEYYK